MKRIFAAIILFNWSITTFACGEPKLFEFRQYTTIYNKQVGLRVHSHGTTTTTNGSVVVINLSFLKDLESNPTGKELEKNREELIYLISSGNDRATKVGMEILYNLILKPTKIKECESTFTLYGPDELAFVLSRTGRFSYMLCEMELNKRLTLVKYYENEPRLWSTGYDAPWIQQNMQCQVTKK